MTRTASPRVVVLNWRDRRHPAAGGAELYCERLARELVRRGRPVVLVTSRPAGTASEETVDGYRIRRLGNRWSVYPLALVWLLRHRSSVGAVIDSQNGIPFFSPLVTGRRIPVLLLVHHVHQDVFARALRPMAARLGRWLEGPASRRAYRGRTLVVLSPSARSEVRRRLRFDGPIRVVPGGADTLGLQARRSATPRVVVVGRLTSYKRLDVLVDAMPEVRRQLPDAELHLVGDGPARAALQERGRAVGAGVVFHGRLPDVRRDALLGSAWVTVGAPDATDWDPSLIEANAAGVPALAPSTGGSSDIIRDGQTGWRVAGEPTGLADALVRVLVTLGDPATAAMVAERARSWAARFTWERTTDGIVQALEFERSRRQRSSNGSRERRSGNDLTAAVSVPRSVLPDGWEALRRAGDVWSSDDGTVRGLLPGADEDDVQSILARLGVDARDPSISVTVARPADLLAGLRLPGQQRIDLADPSSASPGPHDRGDRRVA